MRRSTSSYGATTRSSATLLGVESRYAQLGVARGDQRRGLDHRVRRREYVADVLWRGLAQGVEHDLRVEAYDHAQHLDMSAGTRPVRSGTTLATLNDDVNQLERFLDIGAPAILQTALNVVLVGAVFAAASWQLLLFAFLPIPVIVVGSLLLPAPARAALRPGPRGRRRPVRRADAPTWPASPTIKAFTAEDRERDRVAAVSTGLPRRRTSARSGPSAAFVPLVRMAILAGFTCTLLLGGWAALRGDLEVGLYSVLVFMTQRLLWPLTDVAEVLDLYQRGRASTRPDPAPARRAGHRARPGPASLDRPVARPARAARRPRRVRRRARRAARHRPGRPGRRDARDRRRDRARASRRCCGWCCASTTPGPGQVLLDGQRRARPRLGLAARLDRLRRPGRLHLRRHDRRQHRLRPPGRDRARRSARRPRPPRRVDFIEALPDGLRRLGRRARRDALRRPAPAASRWLGRSCATRPCWCSTRRPARSTTRPRPRSSARLRRATARPHRDRGRAPALHRPARPPDLGARRRHGSSRPAPTTSWSTLGGAYAALWRVQTGALVEAHESL